MPALFGRLRGLGLCGILLCGCFVACQSSTSTAPADDDAAVGGNPAGAGGASAGAGGMANGGAAGAGVAGAGGAHSGGTNTGGAVTGGAGTGGAPTPANAVVIDTHTHFWDPTRPIPAGRTQPIPWPGPGDTALYRKILPPEYATKRAGTGITGTVVVEASGWLEDNQFLLDLAKSSPEILGVVGSFGEVLGTNKFDQALARFKQDPLFRGIRIGGGDVSGALSSPSRLMQLSALANADLTVDTLNVTIADVIKLAVAVPKLRIVVDHMAGVQALDPSGVWKQDIAALAGSAVAKRVYLKLSGLVESAGMSAPIDPSRYAAALDHVWEKLGEDQLLYSTNWPVSEVNAPLATVANIVNAFLATKPATARAKVFATNAMAAYKCAAQR
ncbi:MAG: amidohydrolase family protein [Deltaproteobacteria bacterium]|nr:amidohydrolase family protein [Deltaproteobacteria bacterium]